MRHIISVVLVLVILISSGCVEKKIEDKNKRPLAILKVQGQANVRVTVNVNETVTFDGRESFDPDGDVVKYIFYFGDGLSTGALDQGYYEYVYTRPGDFVATLVVWDDKGDLNYDTLHVHVNMPPVPVISVSTDVAKTFQEIHFSAANSYDPDGKIMQYYWDFGDNVTANGENTTHHYRDNGTYIVVLTVTDNDGKSVSVTRTVVVNLRTYLAIWNDTQEATKPERRGYLADGQEEHFNVTISDLNVTYVNFTLMWEDDGTIPGPFGDDPNDEFKMTIITPSGEENTQIGTTGTLTIIWFWDYPTERIKARDESEAWEIALAMNKTDDSHTGIYNIALYLDANGYFEINETDPGNDYTLRVTYEYYQGDPNVKELKDE